MAYVFLIHCPTMYIFKEYGFARRHKNPLQNKLTFSINMFAECSVCLLDSNEQLAFTSKLKKKLVRNYFNVILTYLTWCRIVSKFFVCDTSAAFSTSYAGLIQCFLSCPRSVISTRSLIECSLI